MYAHTHLSPAAPALHPNSHPHAAAYINTGRDELVESSRWFPRVRVKEITPSKDMQKKDKEERWQSESWRTQLIFSEHNDVISKLDRLKKKKQKKKLDRSWWSGLCSSCGWGHTQSGRQEYFAVSDCEGANKLQTVVRTTMLLSFERSPTCDCSCGRRGTGGEVHKWEQWRLATPLPSPHRAKALIELTSE